MRRANLLGLLSGCVFIVVGFVFMLDRLALITLDERFVVPVILVAIGVWILLGGRDRRVPEPPPPPPPSPPTTDAPPDDRTTPL